MDYISYKLRKPIKDGGMMESNMGWECKRIWLKIKPGMVFGKMEIN